ncbi:UMTA methyltransferase family protein [Pyronema omphalodes]|nr:UMTA methyltransferase family protein [Pyronema omphalodes]
MSTSDAENTIEVDSFAPTPEDTDDEYQSSSYGSYQSSINSVNFSIDEHVYENGRRYHSYFGADKNPLPTDEIEQERLDLHHEIMLMLLKGDLYRAPITNNPKRILDVGTGTGIWAIDMATKFPEAAVIGTDLSPIQPKWAPLNVSYDISDAEDQWDYPPDHFDFIHIRNLAQGITSWSNVLDEVYRCTKPGAWVELAEVGGMVYSDDGTMADDNPLRYALTLMEQALSRLGRPPPSAARLRGYLEEAGFVDIKVSCVKQPMGPWAKDKRLKRIGALVQANLETAVEAYFMALFTRILGMATEEAMKLCDDAVEAAKNKNTHMYNFFYIVYGRKPDADKDKDKESGRQSRS